MNPVPTLLIEDNAAAREGLKARLAAHPEIVVVGEAGTMGRARTLLALGGYELVFLDIHLRGGVGFDLLPLVAPAARVIFVTAFDEYALRAFEVNALDYLLKPVTPERLAKALARLGLGDGNPPPGEAAQAAAPDEIAPLLASDVVHLRSDAGSRFVRVDRLALILAELNYTQITLADGERHLVRRPLREWEARLLPAGFLRVSREALVNPGHVSRIRRGDPKCGQLWVEGSDTPVPVSRRLWPTVRELLRRLETNEPGTCSPF